MKNETVTCDRDGCDIEYIKKTHNQRYCSNECCRLATNKRIMEKYYAKRDQRLGKVRYCSKCQNTKLSRYNDTDVCASCKTQEQELMNSSVVMMLQNASLVS